MKKKTVLIVIITVIVTAVISFFVLQILSGYEGRRVQKTYEETSYPIEEGASYNTEKLEQQQQEPEFYTNEDGVLMNTTDKDAVNTDEIGMDADGNKEESYEEAHCKADGYEENMKALGFPK